MKVLFLPDYRKGNPYQEFLARSLADEGVDVSFVPLQKSSGMPLTRGLWSQPVDLVHLHWPEAYFTRPPWYTLRSLRHRVDLPLALARAGVPMVLTAHDLWPHRAGDNPWVRSAFCASARSARTIIAHSADSVAVTSEAWGVPVSRYSVIPHGDMAESLGPLLDRAAARAAVGVEPDRPLCVVFGAVEPYKGIVEILDFWRRFTPGLRLAVIGRCKEPALAAEIRRAADAQPDVLLHIDRHLPGDELGHWLAAADVTLFNYRKILTSGAACLARSVGLPVVIARRFTTVDLAEPHERVFRFDALDAACAEMLGRAASLGRDPASAASWRVDTAWSNIASQHASVYRAALSR